MELVFDCHNSSKLKKVKLVAIDEEVRYEDKIDKNMGNIKLKIRKEGGISIWLP